MKIIRIVLEIFAFRADSSRQKCCYHLIKLPAHHVHVTQVSDTAET